MIENITLIYSICPLRELGRLLNAHFMKSARILAISQNGLTQCPFHELDNALADFVKD